MRRQSTYLLLLMAVLSSPAFSEVPAINSAEAAIQRASTKNLQARFARLQQAVRPDGVSFELHLVDTGQSLLRQRDDGVVRLPEDWVAAAPDAETLDFLMLLGLSNAITPGQTREGPTTATKVVTGAIGFIGVNAARIRDRQPVVIGLPRFESAAPSTKPDKALRALSWAVASGGCEARVVSGLRRLEAIHGEIGIDSRQIVKDLGAVAWTPNDHCNPPAP